MRLLEQRSEYDMASSCWEKIYKLDNQDLAKAHLGHEVTVSGDAKDDSAGGSSGGDDSGSGSGGTCDSPGVTDSEIKVGALSATTGPYAPFYGQVQAGWTARFEELNEAGGRPFAGHARGLTRCGGRIDGPTALRASSRRPSRRRRQGIGRGRRPCRSP